MNGRGGNGKESNLACGRSYGVVHLTLHVNGWDKESEAHEEKHYIKCYGNMIFSQIIIKTVEIVNYGRGSCSCLLPIKLAEKMPRIDLPSTCPIR